MSAMTGLSFDFKQYSKLVRALASLSGLFTSSSVPYVDSKFVEILYARTSGAENFAFSDMSFDAILKTGQGVGVKTFRASVTAESKKEKVAEFPKAARELGLHNLAGKDLAVAVSELRNKRVHSDIAEFNIRLTGSLYHCLIRLEDGFFVHEEPYALIDVDQLVPTNPRGKNGHAWPNTKGHLHFSDGRNAYTYNVSKNVLYKAFRLKEFTNSATIPVTIEEDPFETLLSLATPSTGITPAPAQTKERVVLPLYSLRNGRKFVFPKSGINQWNAGGRKRQFGEAYIPVPRAIHKIRPNFFPPRNQSFSIILPNGTTVSAKVCQDGDKALMSDPNVDLIAWLFATLDGSAETATHRIEAANPYSYADLVAVGKDCVEILKISADTYEMRMSAIGDFELFVEENVDFV